MKIEYVMKSIWEGEILREHSEGDVGVCAAPLSLLLGWPGHQPCWDWLHLSWGVTPATHIPLLLLGGCKEKRAGSNL